MTANGGMYADCRVHADNGWNENDTINLAYIDGAVSRTATAAITGTAISLAIMTPAPATFPSTAIGATSAPVTVIVNNTGASTATIFSRALVTGTQFTITGGTCVNGLFIGAGSSCTVTVTFNPSGAADTKPIL